MRQGAAVLLVQKLSRSTTGSTRVERDYSQSQMGLDKARNSTGGSRLAENWATNGRFGKKYTCSVSCLYWAKVVIHLPRWCFDQTKMKLLRLQKRGPTNENRYNWTVFRNWLGTRHLGVYQQIYIATWPWNNGYETCHVSNFKPA